MVNILDEIFGYKGAVKIIHALLKTRKGYTGREIARMIGISHQTAHAILGRFAQLNIVFATQIGRAKYYQLNRGHLLIKNIELLIEKCADWYDLIGDFLFTNLPTKPLSIILYGSTARGEETHDSDLDLLFIYHQGIGAYKIMEEITGLSEQVVRMCGHSVSPVIMDVKKFQQLVKEKDQLISQIIIEGMAIAGLTVSEVLSYDRQKDQKRKTSKRKIS